MFFTLHCWSDMFAHLSQTDLVTFFSLQFTATPPPPPPQKNTPLLPFPSPIYNRPAPQQLPVKTMLKPFSGKKKQRQWRSRGAALLTQLLRLRCQQPTCWRRESPGPRTPALAPVSSGPAGAPSRGYMTPSVPPPPPPLPSPPPPPSSSTCPPPQLLLPRLRRGKALSLSLAVPLLHFFSSSFVCSCLDSFLHCVRVYCRACVARACICVCRPPSLCVWCRSQLTIVPSGFWH